MRIGKEGSHRGRVRPPAKRLGGETSLMGSNPIPSASFGRQGFSPKTRFDTTKSCSQNRRVFRLLESSPILSSHKAHRHITHISHVLHNHPTVPSRRVEIAVSGLLQLRKANALPSTRNVVPVPADMKARQTQPLTLTVMLITMAAPKRQSKRLLLTTSHVVPGRQRQHQPD